MGIIPLWGFQLLIAIFLAVLLRLNKALVIIAANISLPPMIPLIIYASYKTGAIWMGNAALTMNYNKSITLLAVKQNLQQYIFGSILLAIVAALFSGLSTYLLLKLFTSKKGRAATI